MNQLNRSISAPEISVRLPPEALLLLNNALGINDVSYLLPETALSSETSQACANLRAVGLICEGELKEETLTRIEAAELIVKALELVKNR